MPGEEEIDDLVDRAQEAAEDVLTDAKLSAEDEVDAYEQLVENMRDELGVRRAALRETDDDEGEEEEEEEEGQDEGASGPS